MKTTSRWLASFFTVGLESLLSLGKLPVPLAYPTLVAAGALMQCLGRLCQACRWIANGFKRPGQGDGRIHISEPTRQRETSYAVFCA